MNLPIIFLEKLFQLLAKLMIHKIATILYLDFELNILQSLF